MYYNPGSCIKCHRKEIEIDKLKNKLRELCSMLERVRKGERLSEAELCRALTRVDGGKRVYVEYD